MHKLLATCIVALCAVADAFGNDAFKKLTDEARALDRARKYVEAAAKYGEAAKNAGDNKFSKANSLYAQAMALQRAKKATDAAAVVLEALKEEHINNIGEWCLFEVPKALAQAKKFAAVTNFFDAAFKTPNLPEATRTKLFSSRAGIMLAQGDVKGARTQYEQILSNRQKTVSDLKKGIRDANHLIRESERQIVRENNDIVTLYTNIRKTYTGRTEKEGFKAMVFAFQRYANQLSEKDKIRFWNDYGYDAYLALYPEAMKRAMDELKKLGQPGVTKYGDRVKLSLEDFAQIDSFPKKESEIKFPKSLTDFDIKMNGKTVYVAKDFGFDPADSTKNLQMALTSGASRVVIENTGKPWLIETVYIPSNIEIVLQKGVRIHADPTWEKRHKTDSDLFRIWNVSNVVIRGECENDTDVLIGVYKSLADRAKNCRDYGGSGFDLRGCENVCIKNMRVADNGMDGICTGGLGKAPTNIYVENVDFDSNFRQACSLVAIRYGYFKNVKFRNTAGAEPAAGIDLEPAELNQANWSIYLFDCTFEGNMGGGLLFSTSAYEPITLYAKRCTFTPQRRGNLMVLIRMGIYMGRNIKVPGKAVFEDCEFLSHSDVSPILIESVSLLDIFFKNCTIKDAGTFLTRGAAADASAVNFHLNRDVWASFGIPDDNAQGTISFENVKVAGYTNAPPVQFKDDAGHYSVRGLKGTIDFNGKKVNMAQYAYKAPDWKYKELPNELPKGLPAPSQAVNKGLVEQSFTFRYDGNWWTPPPSYTYLFYGKKGASAEFLLRYQWFWEDPTIRFISPSGTNIDVGEFKKSSDNLVKITFPETGWYSFHPPSKHVLVHYKGVDLCYYAGASKERKIQIDAPNGYTGYFEVPAGKTVTIKNNGVAFASGTIEIRNAKGELVRTLAYNERTGATYFDCTSASGKTEVWSFTVVDKANFKFFAPATGIWADRPELVPVKDANAVRSPVIKIERAVAKDDDSASATGVSLADYMKRHPIVAKLVAQECESCLAWAKKGEWTKLYEAKKAQLDRMEKNIANEQQAKEFADESKNLPPLEMLAKMEARIPKLSKTELERYAFCNAFAVNYGIYPNKDVGSRFFRLTLEQADIASVDPEVYWWIYKKDYEHFVRNYMKEMQMDYQQFTLICDDDRKLDKLLPTIQKFVTATLPEDTK